MENLSSLPDQTAAAAWNPGLGEPEPGTTPNNNPLPVPRGEGQAATEPPNPAATMPAGITVVDSPLPWAVCGIVNEQDLTEQIGQLWLERQTYNSSIRRMKLQARAVDATLGEMLYTMKAVLSRPGRSGGWSEFLRDRRIPRASADRLVARYQRSLGEDNCLNEAISEPSEESVRRFFTVVWPRLHKKLTTRESVYWFITDLVAASDIDHEFRDGGILVLNSSLEAAGEATAIRPLGLDAAALAGIRGAGDMQSPGGEGS